MNFDNVANIEINGKMVSAMYSKGKLFWSTGKVSVWKLIHDGYATVKECSYTGNVKGQGYGATYYQIQINQNCPYSISEIADFVPVLTNDKHTVDESHDNYFVWNSALPEGWSHSDIISKYNGTTLKYVPSALFGGGNEKTSHTSFWFNSLDFSSCEDFVLVLDASANWNSANAGLLRRRDGGISNTTPKKFTLKFKSSYSSVIQYLFGKLGSTQHIVLDFSEAPARSGGSGENMYCRDMAGLCEWDSNLKTLEVKGKCLFCDGVNISNAFHNCSSLTEVPLFAPAYSRDNWWNTWPVTSIEQAFLNCSELTSIKPTLNMSSITYSSVISSDGAFKGCTKLADVRFKNIKGSWDFTSEKCSLKSLDADSINYILNNVVEVEGQTYTLKFWHTSFEGVDPDAVSAAEAKGYNVEFIGVGHYILTEDDLNLISEDGKSIII